MITKTIQYILGIILTILLIYAEYQKYYPLAKNINNNLNNNTSKEPTTLHNNTIHGNNNIINNYINPNTTSPTCPQNNNEDTYESQEISINKIDNNTYTGKIDSIEEKYKKITFKSESLKQKFNFKDTKKSKYLVSVVIHKNPDNTIKYYEIIEYLGTTD
jgi:hypothetical protein